MKSNRYRMHISPVLLSVVFLVASVFVSMAAQKLSERAPVLTEPVSSARQASGRREMHAAAPAVQQLQPVDAVIRQTGSYRETS